jgi:diaminohydroxyphosphoribosylaminopyrimidine deaminase/5-amino-6-(5-phosphoribosylamino)uracil reductase
VAIQFTEADRGHMARVLDLARLGLGKVSPNPMVGAVLCREGNVLGEGAHIHLGAPHAEVAAIVDARGDCQGATLYVNLEPCCHQGRTPPCVESVIRAGVKRVVAAVEDPNPQVKGQGFAALREAGVRVDVGLSGEESRQLNEAFFTFHTEKRPFFTAKWAMTLDGRTSSDSGASQWISNDVSREYVHRLRSRNDGIMVGVGTVLQDNPRLNVRLKGYRGRQPIRIIIDDGLRSPLGARCLSRRGGGRPAILAASSVASDERVERMRKSGHKVALIPGRKRMVDLKAFAHHLHGEGITSVLIEGGRQIHTSLFRDGLIDKVVVFMAPKLLGGRLATGPLDDLGIGAPTEALELERIEMHHFGQDVCVEGHVVRKGSKRPEPRANDRW